MEMQIPVMNVSRIRKIPLSSLKDESAVKIVIELCGQPDVKSFLEKIKINHDLEVVKDQPARKTKCALHVSDIRAISEKISELPLPRYLQDYVRKFVNTVLIKIYRWKNFCFRDILSRSMKQYRELDLYRHLRWSSRGEIDYVQTSKNLMLKSSLSIREKYHLACYSALSKEAEVLGLQTIDDTYIKTFNSYSACEFHFFQIVLEKLISMGKINVTDVEDFNGNPEDISLRSNTQFLKYMWPKWSAEEKERNFLLILSRFETPDHLRFLLAEMNELDVEIFLAERFVQVYQVLIIEPFWLDWLEILLDEMWRNLDVATFCELIARFPSLKHIANNVCLYDHYIYILEQFRLTAPGHLFERMLEVENGNVAACFLKKYYLWERNLDSIRWVLSRASEQQKKNIIFSSNGMSLCIQLITSCQWKFFITFLNETLLHESLRLEFTKKFKHRHLTIAYNSVKAQHSNCCFDVFVNWAFDGKEITQRKPAPVSFDVLDNEDDCGFDLFED